MLQKLDLHSRLVPSWQDTELRLPWRFPYRWKGFGGNIRRSLSVSPRSITTRARRLSRTSERGTEYQHKNERRRVKDKVSLGSRKRMGRCRHHEGIVYARRMGGISPIQAKAPRRLLAPHPLWASLFARQSIIIFSHALAPFSPVPLNTIGTTSVIDLRPVHKQLHLLRLGLLHRDGF